MADEMPLPFVQATDDDLIEQDAEVKRALGNLDSPFGSALVFVNAVRALGTELDAQAPSVPPDFPCWSLADRLSWSDPRRCPTGCPGP